MRDNGWHQEAVLVWPLCRFTVSKCVATDSVCCWLLPAVSCRPAAQVSAAGVHHVKPQAQHSMSSACTIHQHVPQQLEAPAWQCRLHLQTSRQAVAAGLRAIPATPKATSTGCTFRELRRYHMQICRCRCSTAYVLQTGVNVLQTDCQLQMLQTAC